MRNPKLVSCRWNFDNKHGNNFVLTTDTIGFTSFRRFSWERIRMESIPSAKYILTMLKSQSTNHNVYLLADCSHWIRKKQSHIISNWKWTMISTILFCFYSEPELICSTQLAHKWFIYNEWINESTKPISTQ